MVPDQEKRNRSGNSSGNAVSIARRPEENHPENHAWYDPHYDWPKQSRSGDDQCNHEAVRRNPEREEGLHLEQPSDQSPAPHGEPFDIPMPSIDDESSKDDT